MSSTIHYHSSMHHLHTIVVTRLDILITLGKSHIFFVCLFVCLFSRPTQNAQDPPPLREHVVKRRSPTNIASVRLVMDCPNAKGRCFEVVREREKKKETLGATLEQPGFRPPPSKITTSGVALAALALAWL